jgi:exodeoxyribonuclease VII large subunit
MSDFSTDGGGPVPGEPAGPGNLPEFSVSEISNAVKRTLETSFDRVRVRGEISGFKRASSGHLYLALKDESAVLDGVCWRGVANRLGLQPEDGMEVIVVGRLTSYPGRSKYQIVIDSMELAGAGALLKLLEDRKRKLAAEGLFDAERKRSLPFLPDVIGVVTSPTGAVIRDIMHRLSERFPRRVLVWPVLVQGETAAAQVAAAIRGFNALPKGGAVPRPDVLIVARGGGSLEDLWAFNEEVVVRAAAESEIPLISAVGHETDTTLIDFVSDRRAPTPTAAAEIAVPVRAELATQTMDLGRRMLGGAGRFLAERRMAVEGLGRGLPEPKRLIEEKAQRLDDSAERLSNAMANLVAYRRGALVELAAQLPHPRQQIRLSRQQLAGQAERLQSLKPRLVEPFRQSYQRIDAVRRLGEAGRSLIAERRRGITELNRVLESVSYKNVLRRGFAVVRSGAGAVVRAGDVSEGMGLGIEFQDGQVSAVAGSVGAHSITGGPPNKRQPAAKPESSKLRTAAPTPVKEDPQGSLL